MQQENRKSIVMRRSGWGSFSIIAVLIFGIILPAILFTHVFADYVSYVGGYAKYARSTVEESITSYTQGIDGLNEDIFTAEEEVRDMESMIAQLEEEIQTLTASRAQKEKAKKAQEKTSADLQTELDALTQELNALKTDKALLIKVKEGLEEDLVLATENFQKAENSLEASKEAVKNAEISLLQAKKAVLEQKIVGLNEYEVDARKQVNATIEDLVAEIGLLEAEISQKNTTINENKTEAKRLEYEEMNPNLTAIKEATGQRDKVNKTVEKLLGLVLENDKKIVLANNEIKDLETQIINTKPSLGDLAVQLTDLELEIEAVEQEYSQYKKEYEQIKANPTATVEQEMQISEKLTETEARLEELKIEQQAAQNEYAAAYEKRKGQEKQIAELNQTIAQLEEARDKAAAEANDHNSGDNTYSVSYFEGLIKAHQEKADAAKQKIDDLVKTNAELEEEIKNNKQTIEEKQKEKISWEKVLNGLDQTMDASEIENIQKEIQAMDEQITKWQTNQLEVKATVVEAYTGSVLTLKQQAEKAAVEALNARKVELKTAQDNEKEWKDTIASLRADLSAKESEIQAQTTACNNKERQVNSKKSALMESQNKEVELETDIQDLTKSIDIKNADKQRKQEEKAQLTEKIAKNKLTLEERKARKNQLQELLKSKTTSLLAAEDVAMVKAYEKDELAIEKPYKASAGSVGIFATTKLMFESLNLDMGTVEILSYVFILIGLTLLISVAASTVLKIKRAQEIRYEVSDEYIQCRVGATVGKKFILEYGATVNALQSAKGSLFDYGSITITRGLGMAGEFTMRNIKNVNKMKALLKAKIAQLPRETERNTQQSFMPNTQMSMPCAFPIPPTFMQNFMPKPMATTLPMNMEVQEEECVYNEPYDEE